jgi:uncharacterized membrane protein
VLSALGIGISDVQGVFALCFLILSPSKEIQMNSPNSPKGVQGGGMRGHFWRGLFVVIPVAVTVWLVNYAVSLTDNWLGPVVRLVAEHLLPSTVTSQAWFADVTALFSLLLVLACLIMLGVVASYRMGKEGLRLIDHLFIHIPGVNSIYRSVRKLVDAFGNSDAQSFKRCVYLNFPATNPTLGFVTKEVVEDGTGRKLLVVFIPQCPNPTGGFIQIVAEEATWDAGISPEDGFKMVMSMGVLSPDKMPQAKPRN